MLMQYGEQDTIFSASGGNNTPSGTGGMTGAGNADTQPHLLSPPQILIPFGEPGQNPNTKIDTKISLPKNKMDILILVIVIIIVYKAFF